MERTDPRQTFGRKARFYATSEAHTEAESLEAMARLARVRPGDRALDVATGAGHAGSRLLRAGAEVVGLDLTREMLQEARSLYSGTGLALVQADVARLPFRECSFDLIVSRRAPHHFPDIQVGLRCMRDALRPGGALVIDDRTVPEDDFVDLTMNHLDRLHDRSHVREHRPSEWRRLVEGSGLRLEHLETYERRRPLGSLTQTAREDDAKEIERIVSSLSPEEMRRMGIDRSGDEVKVTHWFVLLRAVRP
jgi:ubiquinone/menaquinone biosynthesis C-methylase UbiE